MKVRKKKDFASNLFSLAFFFRLVLSRESLVLSETARSHDAATRGCVCLFAECRPREQRHEQTGKKNKTKSKKQIVPMCRVMRLSATIIPAPPAAAVSAPTVPLAAPLVPPNPPMQKKPRKKKQKGKEKRRQKTSSALPPPFFFFFTPPLSLGSSSSKKSDFFLRLSFFLQEKKKKEKEKTKIFYLSCFLFLLFSSLFKFRKLRNVPGTHMARLYYCRC